MKTEETNLRKRSYICLFYIKKKTLKLSFGTFRRVSTWHFISGQSQLFMVSKTKIWNRILTTPQIALLNPITCSQNPIRVGIWKACVYSCHVVMFFYYWRRQLWKRQHEKQENFNFNTLTLFSHHFSLSISISFIYHAIYHIYILNFYLFIFCVLSFYSSICSLHSSRMRKQSWRAKQNNFRWRSNYQI